MNAIRSTLAVVGGATAALAFLLGLAACKQVALDAVRLDVQFSWEGIPRCARVSPEFRIANIPPGTRYLAFRMVDEQVPTYPHGGSTVPYTGGDTVPRGAVSYVGPCPPGGSHDYRWEVQALDESGNTILGQGAATRPFPPR